MSSLKECLGRAWRLAVAAEALGCVDQTWMSVKGISAKLGRFGFPSWHCFGFRVHTSSSPLPYKHAHLSRTPLQNPPSPRKNKHGSLMTCAQTLLVAPETTATSGGSDLGNGSEPQPPVSNVTRGPRRAVQPRPGGTSGRSRKPPAHSTRRRTS